jgi:glycosyltransferase involved in cell wall biosynthesis
MARFLPTAIESVLDQSFTDYEIIIVDDGSVDETKNVVEKYAKSHARKIRYIYQENHGVAIARNTGIECANGQYISILDADDKYCPERLQRTVAEMEQDKNIGLVHGKVISISEGGKVLYRERRNKRYLTGDIFKYLYTRKADIACPTVLVRRSCFDDVGLFDRRLARLGCEDREQWLRISSKYKIQFIDRFLAYYRHTDGSMSQNREKMVRARYYVAEKYYHLNQVSNVLRKKALHNIHREIGDQLLCDKKWVESIRQYLTAIKLWPVGLWPWVNIIKALCRIDAKRKYGKHRFVI